MLIWLWLPFWHPLPCASASNDAELDAEFPESPATSLCHTCVTLLAMCPFPGMPFPCNLLLFILRISYQCLNSRKILLESPVTLSAPPLFWNSLPCTPLALHLAYYLKLSAKVFVPPLNCPRIRLVLLIFTLWALSTVPEHSRYFTEMFALHWTSRRIRNGISEFYFEGMSFATF